MVSDKPRSSSCVGFDVKEEAPPSAKRNRAQSCTVPSSSVVSSLNPLSTECMPPIDLTSHGKGSIKVGDIAPDEPYVTQQIVHVNPFADDIEERDSISFCSRVSSSTTVSKVEPTSADYAVIADLGVVSSFSKVQPTSADYAVIADSDLGVLLEEDLCFDGHEWMGAAAGFSKSAVAPQFANISSVSSSSSISSTSSTFFSSKDGEQFEDLQVDVDAQLERQPISAGVQNWTLNSAVHPHIESPDLIPTASSQFDSIEGLDLNWLAMLERRDGVASTGLYAVKYVSTDLDDGTLSPHPSEESMSCSSSEDDIHFFTGAEHTYCSDSDCPDFDAVYRHTFADDLTEPYFPRPSIAESVSFLNIGDSTGRPSAAGDTCSISHTRVGKGKVFSLSLHSACHSDVHIVSPTAASEPDDCVTKKRRGRSRSKSSLTVSMDSNDNSSAI